MNRPAPTTSPNSAPRNRSLIHRLESILQPLNLAELFSSHQPLEVELGSGDGSFLAQYAQAHPARNFIGVERLLGRLRKLDRKGLRGGLTNLCLVRIEASYFLEYLLPSRSANVLHVYFPDPWPKRRHRGRRLVNARFLDLAAEALAPAGQIYFRTDDADYFAQMRDLFSGSGRFQGIATPEALAGRLTDFERDFLQRGVATLRAAYQRT